VHHRPGHSPTDTIFLDRERRILLAADHLLKHISSNPLITRPRDGSTRRPHALVTYLESLGRTREMDVDLILTGHGEPITDHRTLIDERFALHRRRADKIHRLLEERPRSAYEVAQALWGNVAVTQAFLTLSEVLGHMDLLTREDRAVESAATVLRCSWLRRSAALGRGDRLADRALTHLDGPRSLAVSGASRAPRGAGDAAPRRSRPAADSRLGP
jgi:hypothetical protein